MKDPALLFYTSDFLIGVIDMSMEDRGKYITILATMHQKGRLTEETIRFLVGSISVSLSAKFKIDDNGRWYNDRLESAIEERKIWTESRRKNGQKGGRPKKSSDLKPYGSYMDKPTENHMGDEDEDINENVIVKQKGGPGEKTESPAHVDHPGIASIDEVIQYLNEKVGANYDPGTYIYRYWLNKRILLDRVPVQTLMAIIDLKVSEWKGTKLHNNLSPDTLFGEKYDKYLNQLNHARSKAHQPAHEERDAVRWDSV